MIISTLDEREKQSERRLSEANGIISGLRKANDILEKEKRHGIAQAFYEDRIQDLEGQKSRLQDSLAILMDEIGSQDVDTCSELLRGTKDRIEELEESHAHTTQHLERFKHALGSVQTDIEGKLQLASIKASEIQGRIRRLATTSREKSSDHHELMRKLKLAEHNLEQLQKTMGDNQTEALNLQQQNTFLRGQLESCEKSLQGKDNECCKLRLSIEGADDLAAKNATANANLCSEVASLKQQLEKSEAQLKSSRSDLAPEKGRVESIGKETRETVAKRGIAYRGTERRHRCIK